MQSETPNAKSLNQPRQPAGQDSAQIPFMAAEVGRISEGNADRGSRRPALAGRGTIHACDCLHKARDRHEAVPDGAIERVKAALRLLITLRAQPTALRVQSSPASRISCERSSTISLHSRCRADGITSSPR